MAGDALALQTEGLVRSFGRIEVIRGLELQVPVGTVYGFLGRNGAGKTTAIRMVMGILRPDAGTLTLGGRTVRRTTSEMRQRVGYVSQQQHFYPWMRVRRLGSFVGAFYPTWDAGRFRSLCQDLAIRLDQRVGELSGGTRMKLAMALALAHRPPLLVLDEPTAGVDPVTRREILDLLRSRVDDEGVTVLFSTHQISEIEDIGDQVGILHEGRVFWQGPVADLADRVRLVRSATPDGTMPLHTDGRGTVVWGPPELLRDLPDAEPVSLESAFVAIARQDRPLVIPALLGKELQQHGPAFVAAYVFVASILVCLWFTALYQDSITLLESAHSVALYVLPVLVLYVDGRLVVDDHDQGTSEFLAGLPIGPVSRTLVRFGVGWATIGVALGAVLLSTAALASRREGVPVGWVLQLGVQLGVYLTAWHGVAFGVAHLGTWRWLAWWCLLVSASIVGIAVVSPASTFYWFGLVVDGPDRTRLAPPWGALPVTVLWAVGGLSLALFLATWRGGVLVDRLFRTPTADQRARQIGVGVAWMLVASAVADQAPAIDGWETLPAVPSTTATVRVAASPGDPLWEVGTAAAAALDGLGAELGIRSWPPVVLLRSRAEPGRRVVRPAPGNDGEPSRVLLVDLDHPVDDVVRRVVSEALVHRMAGLAWWDADAQWVVDGAGPWWLGKDRPPGSAGAGPDVLGRRAALGAGMAGDAVDDWPTVVARLGPDTASGVAWAGLVALEEEAGRDAVLDLLRAVLSPEWSTRWPDGVALRWRTRGDWVGRRIGIDRARRIALWEAELARTGAPTVPVLPGLRLEARDGAVVAAWDGAVPPGTMLELAVVDGLQRGWLPGDPTEVVTLPEVREVQLRVDVRARVAAQLVVDADAVGGQVTTGVGRVPMIALLKKETEALLPYWLAFTVLIVFNLAAVLWDPSYVGEGLAARLSNGEGNASTLVLLALLVGHGGVAHELRDGHIEFLDGLPITRGRIFAAKVVAALLPCVAVVGASFAMDVTLAQIAAPPYALSALEPILTMHAVMLACAVGGLGVGMLLSWLGPLAWGVLGFGWVAAGLVAALFPPLLGWVPILGTFGALAWDHGTASHPVAPPVVLAVVGVLSMAASGLLFLGPGQVLTVRGSSVVAAVRFGLGGCLGLVLVPSGLVGGLTLLISDGGALFRGVDVMQTAGFRILYAPEDRGRAEGVASEVDALSAEVGALVGDPEPLRLDIELLGAPRNHLGVFTGGKIRLAATADLDTLAHELTHAHAFALAGPSGWIQQDHTHFFEEGLADWVSARIAGTPEVPEVAAAVWATGQGRFEDLVDHDRYVARHDVRQSYALGQVFAAALVEVGGPGAPGCVLSGIREVVEPVAGLALWYGLAARCDIDLDRVQDRWEAMLVERGTTLPAMPQLRAGVTGDPPSVWVRDERELGWDLLCGFRDDGDVPPDRWVFGPAEDGECAVPVGQLAGREFQYQVGFRMPGDVREGLGDVYLEWTDATR